MVTSPAELENQDTSFKAGPTPNAPASGAKRQVPSSGLPPPVGGAVLITTVCSFVIETSFLPGNDAVTVMVYVAVSSGYVYVTIGPLVSSTSVSSLAVAPKSTV